MIIWLVLKYVLDGKLTGWLLDTLFLTYVFYCRIMCGVIRCFELGFYVFGKNSVWSQDTGAVNLEFLSLFGLD